MCREAEYNMSCTGKCVKYKAHKKGGTSWYRAGFKLCTYCEKFLDIVGVYCPCCGYQLRTRPKNKKYKELLREMKNE